MEKLPYTVRAQEDQTGATTSSVHQSRDAAIKAARQFRQAGYEKVWIEDSAGTVLGPEHPDF
jgi:hypothetical protein